MALTNEALVQDIDACKVPRGGCAYWWLGQHSFALKLGGHVLYLDPFLSPHPRRNVPPLLRPQDLAHAELVFGTHDHTDHIDRKVWPAIAAAAPRARFVVPRLVLPRLVQDLAIPEERFLGMTDGETEVVGELRITALASAHEFLSQDQATGLYPFLGFVIDFQGLRVYHSGDSCLYEGLHAKLRALAPALVFLPINGRDAARLERNCIGNMTYQETADLAGALAPRVTVPTHWDMFNGNTEDPERFRRYMAVKYPQLEVRVPRHGEREVVGL